MQIAVGIVGFGEWEKYTLPFIQSVKKHEPNAKVVVIDQGYYYEDHPDVYHVDDVGYAYGLNKAIGYIGKADWYILCNHDVICEGNFIHKFKKLDPYALYGLQYNGNSEMGKYIEGWIYVLSKEAIDILGAFDEKYKVAGYEDVDYSKRATIEGLPLSLVELPFRHLKTNTRKNKNGYPEIRKENREHFVRKFRWVN